MPGPTLRGSLAVECAFGGVFVRFYRQSVAERGGMWYDPSKESGKGSRAILKQTKGKAAFVRSILVVLALACGLTAGAAAPPQSRVLLLGEQHGDAANLERESELWSQCYQQGMRHLFVEYPYYDAWLLNRWMQAEDDQLLEQFFQDIAGTAADTQPQREFFRQIKAQQPETVFHGTDIGHQYWSSGQRCLELLRAEDRQDSPEYRRTQQVMQQGAQYYTGQQQDLTEASLRQSRPADQTAEDYREQAMTENFIWELDQLEGQSVLGIYGRAHLQGQTANGLPRMADRLKQHYGPEQIQTLDLHWRIESPAARTLTLGGGEYPAVSVGREDISDWAADYASRSFWRLEDASGALSAAPLSGDVLPYHNYPVQVEVGQAFAVEYIRKNGESQWLYYRADGTSWNGQPATVGILP